MLTLVTLPCLTDNYAYLLHDDETGATAAIDVPEAAPILRELKMRAWHLSEIWLTHHHWDHIDGVADLVAATGAPVLGAAADAHRLPPLARAVSPGETFLFGSHTVDILDVPGHTIGHIAFHVPAARAAFTGDSLMVMGCGRLFEGSPEQMWHSLSALAKLPADTNICSGHEYTASNAAFAVTIEPDNAALAARRQDIDKARAQRLPTVPAPLSLELATNPFLRAHLPEVKAALGMTGAADVDVFAEIRHRKDTF
ncbi:hydroxyacylglutathione hydrolase [Aliiroseovarius crassostreae]|uniref:Hydroxyacylglutathione hydrolase n=1 Tax=Aliiroseovarius crassostreae TaxID=154981 RepID=A0A0N8IBX3_9RHOB|nr:hydroxyacylglutathione hydrolase [Aliiroseovarius crassostreae]KPN64307.1 hydroxyacylglutathione hydrolase [Aliiroseovarius crassostreae]SFU32172.1 hydroxyacylglutathione hydrolase [Aliiroseovarius crassostreae]